MTNKSPLLFVLVFSVLLVGTLGAVSAVSVTGEWLQAGQRTQSLTIDSGSTAAFTIWVESNNPPISDVDVKLYKGGSLVRTFTEDGSTTLPSYSRTYTVSPSSSGSYTVSISASDGDGSGEQSLSLTVLPEEDTTDPVVTITSPANGRTYDSHITSISYTASDDSGRALVSCQYSTDGGVTRSQAAGCRGHFSATSSEGANTWVVYATDDSGNTGSASVTFNVDTSHLSVTGEWLQAGQRTQSLTIDSGSTAAFTIWVESNNPPISDVDVKLYKGGSLVRTFTEDGSTTLPSYSRTYTVSPSSSGSYTVSISASDSRDSDSHTLSLTVLPEEDTTDPVVAITSPANGRTYDSHITSISYTASDDSGRALVSCQYSTDGGVTRSQAAGCRGHFSATSSEGANTWVVYATDDSGNTGSASVTFNVDTSSDPQFFTVSGNWDQGGQSKTLNDGDSTSFSVAYYTSNSPITGINVGLYDSAGDFVHAFETDAVVRLERYTTTYNIGKSIYGGVGSYSVRISAYDGNGSYGKYTLSLRVVDATPTPPVEPTPPTPPVEPTPPTPPVEPTPPTPPVEPTPPSDDDDSSGSGYKRSYYFVDATSDAEYFDQFAVRSSLEADDDEAPKIKKWSFWDWLVGIVKWLFGL